MSARELILGDCRQVLAGLEPCSVDAVVTDPPYELGFMGKGWDSAGVSFQPATWREVLRVLKPGGHLLAFGGTRTYHRLACALEDAGFEIRDCVCWLYGSGFPKSRNIGDGWGTALKPAFEPIVVARKPLAGTVAGNVLAHGVGAINVDGCRIAFRDELDELEAKGKNRHADFGSGPRDNRVYGADERARGEHGNYDPPGRWPANVTLDEDAAAMLDEQTGELSPGYWAAGGERTPLFESSGIRANVGSGARGESGGASRFFYVAKASRAERDAGLEGFEPRQSSKLGAGIRSSVGRPVEGTTSSEDRRAANHHPTVKPVALMRWLVRLVTPPGGLVVDPFLGSGTTGIAAALEGFGFLGVELDAEYLSIAEARIRFWQENGERALEVVAEQERAEVEREAVKASGQTDIFDLFGEAAA